MNSTSCNDSGDPASSSGAIESIGATTAEATKDSDAPIERTNNPAARTFRLRLILFIGVLLGICSSLITFALSSNQYTATEQFHIRQDNVELLPDKEAMSDLAFKNYKETQRRMLLHPFVVAMATRDPAIANLPILKEKTDPVGWLTTNIKISDDSSELMTVSLTLDDPVAAYKLLTSLIDVYFREVVQRETHARRQRIESLQKELQEVEQKQRQMRVELKHLEILLGIPGRETGSLIDLEISARIVMLVMELQAIEREMASVDNGSSGKTIPEIDSDQTVAASEPAKASDRLQSLEKRLKALKDELRDLRRPDHSSIDHEWSRDRLDAFVEFSKKLELQVEIERINLHAPPRISRLDSTGIPQTADMTARIRRSIIAGLLGFLVIIPIFFSLSASRSRTRRTSEAMN